MGRHYVGGPVVDPRNGLRLGSHVLGQHQRQDLRDVLDVAGTITTVIRNCQALEHDNLPGE